MKHLIQHPNTRARMRRIAACILTALLTVTVCTLFALPSSAASAVRVTVNGSEIVQGKARIIDSTTYVPFRAFANEAERGSTVTWSASTRTAKMSFDGNTVSAAVGKSYLLKNGEKITSTAKNRLVNGTLYVPVRPMATALGYTVTWNSKTYTAALKTKSGSSSGSSGNTSGSTGGSSTSYTETDLYWMARIIEAEAGGEPYRGKLAVGTVIMNRVKASAYPSSVYGVIFDKRHGVQFTPAYNGKIYKTPSASSVAAAKEVLSGYRIPGNIQYFLNPSIASDTWFRKNLTYVCTIGNHDFYAP